MRPFTLLLALLVAGLPLAAHAQATLLMDRPGFRQCEWEGFTSLIIARNAMQLKDTRESLLAVKSNGPFVIATINELFDEMEKTGGRNHGVFAAKKFYQCAKRENLPIAEGPPNAWICLARQDILFYANTDRVKGRSPDESRRRLKAYLGDISETVYPPALVDRLVPMVYNAADDDDELELRRLVFESCLFPDDWKAWFPVNRPGQPLK
jgi:hypothetical protein